MRRATFIFWCIGYLIRLLIVYFIMWPTAFVCEVLVKIGWREEPMLICGNCGSSPTVRRRRWTGSSSSTKFYDRYRHCPLCGCEVVVGKVKVPKPVI